METRMSPIDQCLHNLSYHRPDPESDVMERMDALRLEAKKFALHVALQTKGIDMPRELQMAYRSLEDALMYAIAGLARHG